MIQSLEDPMDYRYENLGPERFQQFCQALLVREVTVRSSHVSCRTDLGDAPSAEGLARRETTHGEEEGRCGGGGSPVLA